MADLAARIPLMATSDLALLEGGAAILGIAFLVKAGMWPLSFWLPTTYAAAAPPVAALFAIMSKVGIYVILRLSSLFFGQDDGAAAGFRSEEHTSELQSLMRISYAVFCLKKKKKNTE